MASAQGTIETIHYVTTIDTGGHRIIADEAKSAGGANAGPDPYGLLLAGLCACTAITLRMYADRKKWDLTRLTVDLRYTRSPPSRESIARTLFPEGNLTDEQRARLADIAERTPVTLTLKRGIAITTTLVPAAATVDPALDKRLDEALDESFPASDPPSVSLD